MYKNFKNVHKFREFVRLCSIKFDDSWIGTTIWSFKDMTNDFTNYYVSQILLLADYLLFAKFILYCKLETPKYIEYSIINYYCINEKILIFLRFYTSDKICHKICFDLWNLKTRYVRSVLWTIIILRAKHFYSFTFDILIYNIIMEYKIDIKYIFSIFNSLYYKTYFNRNKKKWYIVRYFLKKDKIRKH